MLERMGQGEGEEGGMAALVVSAAGRLAGSRCGLAGAEGGNVVKEEEGGYGIHASRRCQMSKNNQISASWCAVPRRLQPDAIRIRQRKI